MASDLRLNYDVLISGSGAAGLSLALRLAGSCRVCVLSKGDAHEGATFYAQGGIAAVFATSDSIEAHVSDTLIAGDGLCEREASVFVASHGRQCVHWLIDYGVAFDLQTSDGVEPHHHLTREAGHSQRRILHSADATGKAVSPTLLSLAQAHRNIDFLAHHQAIDLVSSRGDPARIAGAWVWDSKQQKILYCSAGMVVLATGGASQVYQYSSTPSVATGDGIAMAWCAGCRVANLEFNQFHPTSLYHPEGGNFLLSEALRGEGAWLRRPDGSRFMPD